MCMRIIKKLNKSGQLKKIYELLFSLHFKIDIRSITLNAWSYINFKPCETIIYIHTKLLKKRENSEKRVKEEI